MVCSECHMKILFYVYQVIFILHSVHMFKSVLISCIVFYITLSIPLRTCKENSYNIYSDNNSSLDMKDRMRREREMTMGNHVFE